MILLNDLIYDMIILMIMIFDLEIFRSFPWSWSFFKIILMILMIYLEIFRSLKWSLYSILKFLDHFDDLDLWSWKFQITSMILIFDLDHQKSDLTHLWYRASIYISGTYNPWPNKKATIPWNYSILFKSPKLARKHAGSRDFSFCSLVKTSRQQRATWK